MLAIYKTQNGVINEIESFEPDAWVNLVSPTEEELKTVIDSCGIEPDFIRAALDEEETSRIETEDNQTLIIVDIPFARQENKIIIYETIPLGIVIAKNCIVTVCLKESAILKDFSDGLVKQVETYMKTRFLLQILYRMTTKYLQFLKQIDKISHYIEKQLHISMKNKELIQLLDLEKSLVFFSTSLRANEVTLEKTTRGRYIKMYEEDQDLLEDVLIEVKQAIEMSNIYSNILSGTMDAFASVISNNLNIVMKRLTVITILMAIPTMIASFFGMNVSRIPIPSFWVIVGVSAVITLIVGIVLYRKKLF